jgi:ferredoxin
VFTAPGDSPSRHGRRGATPFVALDRSRCTACWDCIAVCPESVLGKIDVWLHRHAVVRDGDRCTGCRRCIKACAAGALSDRDGGRRPPNGAPAQHRAGPAPGAVRTTVDDQSAVPHTGAAGPAALPGATP